MRDAFVDTLCELAQEDENIYLITGDLGYNVLDKFWNQYPERFLNVGICEQNMASIAAGLAVEGDKSVFIYSIGNFPTLRCLEQIRNDIAYHHANVKIVSVGAGFAYGPMGMSHHATEDVAVLRSIPGVKVFTPADPFEARIATQIANKLSGPVYLRLGKGHEPNLERIDTDIQYGKMSLLKEGEDTAILAMGAIAGVALEAAKCSKEKIAVYSVPFIKPFDTERVKALALKYKVLYTLEEHNRIGGLGSAVSEAVADYGLGIKVVRLGLDETFTGIVGDQNYLRKAYRINAESILDYIRENQNGQL